MRFPDFPFPLNVSRAPVPIYMPYGLLCGSLGTRASAAWPTANLALYIPVRFYERTNIGGLSVANGSAVSGNICAAVYSEDGTRLGASGSVAQTGTNSTQFMGWTGGGFWVGPGLYFFGIAMDNTTGQLLRMTPGIQQLRAIGLFQQASAFPLPANATFAQMATNYIPTHLLSMTARTGFQSVKPAGLPALPTIHTYSHEAIGGSLISRGGPTINSLSSAVWPVANWGVLTPFALSKRTSFSRIFVFNGGVASGNIDLGIYGMDLTRIVSTGSTAMSGTNQLQVLNLSFTIGPGKFYFGLACDNTTAQFMRATVSIDDFAFVASETSWGQSMFPLPATFVINQFPNYCPLLGIAKGTVI